ncbi:kinase-like domain-containing protein [Gongronella butleri]|nr:kinase-like domain-containing protein [Gongronella butleri]
MKRSISYSVPVPSISSGEPPSYAHHQWIRTWIESILERPLPTSNLFLGLRDGVLLCRLVNQLKPNTIAYIDCHESRAAKEHNIGQFLQAGPLVGLQHTELFKVHDLLQGKDMNAVIWTLYRLAMTVNQQPSAWSSYDLHGLTTNTVAMVMDDNIGAESSGPAQETRRSSCCSFQEEQEQCEEQVEEGEEAQENIHCENDTNTTVHSSFAAQHQQHSPHYTTKDAFGSHSSRDSPRHSLTRLPSPPQAPDRTTAAATQDIPHHLATLFERPPSPCSRNSSTTSSPSSTSKSSTFARWTPPFANLGKKFALRQQNKTPFHMRYQEWADRKSAKPSVVHLFSGNDSKRRPSSTTSSQTQDSPDSTLSNRAAGPMPTTSPLQDLVQPSMSTPLLLKMSDPRGTAPTQRHFHHHAPSIAPNSSHHHDGGPILRRKSTGALQHATSAPADSMTLMDPTGHVPGKFKLGNTIGKGQFGVVYRALELRTGKMVAVKRIKCKSSKKRDMADMMQEARLLQSLAHENIVKYEGLVQTPGYINIILEFVENGSLANTLKSFGSFPEDLVATYCSQILHGLEYLHAQNVVHCDLKAANLLTTKSGNLKLSDFGVSLHLAQQVQQEDEVAGTPYWMAPEVIALEGASTKSDIWSLGCTLIELCTGKPPYSEFNHYYALYHIVDDEYPPFPSGLSDDLYDFLRNCFAKQPEDRPSATELLLHAWIYTHTAAGPTNNECAAAPLSPFELGPPPPLTPTLSNADSGLLTTLDAEKEQIDTTTTHETDETASLEADDATPAPESRRTSTATPTTPNAPHTPRDDTIDDHRPPWMNNNKSSSMLVDKFQQQQRQRQAKPAHHRYVKGTFSKGKNGKKIEKNG